MSEIDYDPIAIPGQLFTWVDIDQYFEALAVAGRWPIWLREVSGYWDAVEFRVTPGSDRGVMISWLNEYLGPLTIDWEIPAVRLEAGDHGERLLPISFVEVDNSSGEIQRFPRWLEGRVFSELNKPLPRPDQETIVADIPVCAFHSFKGGVGRTLHCVALAHTIAARPGQKVLLVDADLEAPGVSWMVREQGVRTDFSLEAFMALLQGSSDGSSSEAVSVGRRFLANQEVDGVFILPARRDPQVLDPVRISPADLLGENRTPYLLTEALAELASAVGATCVLVDLRAGASELNAPLLLDPRVHRVFVTTVSDQSVRGTERILTELARRAPARAQTDPAPTVLITQFRQRDHSDLLASVAGDLSVALALANCGSEQNEDQTSADLAANPLRSGFNPELLALPASWSEVEATIARTRVGDSVEELADALCLSTAQLDENAEMVVGVLEGVAEAREKLAEHAKRFTFAETATATDLLRTDSLENLVAANRTEAPIEIVVGAKGSGKTFTYRALCGSDTWVQFARDLGVGSVDFDARLVPVLRSRNLAGDASLQLDNLRRQAVDEFGGSMTSSLLEEIVTDALAEGKSESEWRKIWLRCLAASVGYQVDSDDVEDRILELARSRKAIFVIDGLEDLFQNISESEQEQRALRVLLTTCVDWLRSLRGRPLGLVVFVRRDLVQSAIPQNSAQFLARYQNYELRWDPVEALRLVAWVCDKSGALSMANPSKIPTQSEADLSDHLLGLWGQRLGSLKSKEARSKEWFIAALSDFNQQIQARDIVSFLAVAARGSAEEEASKNRWNDRVLTPNSMRRALPECSREKITSISEENPSLGVLLERLRGSDEHLKKVPFTAVALELSASDISLLERNGVVFRESDEYWMPEIYRQGLDFRAGRRPRVLAVAKLVRKRNDAP